MKKFRYNITAALLALITGTVTAAGLFTKKSTESFQENRKLADIHDTIKNISESGKAFDGLSVYFADHFVGRNRLITAKADIDSAIGEKIVNDVYIADNMLLDASRGDTGLFSSEAVRINGYAKKYKGTVYFTAIPSSSGTYSELLPEHLRTDDQEKDIEMLYSELDSAVKTINAYNILKMLNDNYIYYRNDSKWTSYGAYCVYRSVIQKLGFLPTAYDRYTIEHISSDFRGNLYNRSQYDRIKPDIIDIYSYDDGSEVLSCRGISVDGKEIDVNLYNKDLVGSSNEYGVYPGGDSPILKIRTNIRNNKKLLVIKDDYANCFIPFLLQHYSEIAVVTPEKLTKNTDLPIDPDDYEQTLFLFGIEDLEKQDYFEKICFFSD